MYGFIDNLAEVITLQLQILVKRKAITQSEYDLIKENMQPDSLIADLVPILQVILDREVAE